MRLRTILFIAAAGSALGLSAGVAYQIAATRGQEPTAMRSAPPISVEQASATGILAVHDTPRPVPDLRFIDGNEQPMTLQAFQGGAVLLNVWATWCAPCRKEMPALDRLQATLGGPEFEVVALSIDRTGLAAVEDFYRELGLTALGIYLDESAQAPVQLAAVGLPTTLLIDRQGEEIGRLVGAAEWDSPEMIARLQAELELPAATEVNRASER